MSPIKDDDLFAVMPRFPNCPDQYEDPDGYRAVAKRFADRFCKELNQIIVGKLSQEDIRDYNELIKLDYNFLLYILFKKESVEGINHLSSYRNPGSPPIETDGPFPWFKPVYKYLKSKIPDIYEIGQTLRKDITSDFTV